jgi:hypothetical protein
MQPSLWDLSSLGLGEGSRKPGLPRAVSFSFGWCSTIGFGLQIDLQRGTWPIQSLVPYVIKRMKQ